MSCNFLFEKFRFRNTILIIQQPSHLPPPDPPPPPPPPPLTTMYKHPVGDLNSVTHVDPALQQQRLLRRRWLQAQPHLRNRNLRPLNPNRVDLDSHERDVHPERFPRVHNIPQSRNQKKNLEDALRPMFYHYIPDLFRAAFGVFVSGYDALGVMGDELVYPTMGGNSDNAQSSSLFDNDGNDSSSRYQFTEPAFLIRIGYTLVQFAQSVVGFVLKAVFFPYVGSFDHHKAGV